MLLQGKQVSRYLLQDWNQPGPATTEKDRPAPPPRPPEKSDASIELGPEDELDPSLVRSNAANPHPCIGQ